MADLFNIGLSGLRGAQTNLSVTGQNITNVNTPGYTRQTALQAARDPSFTGAGYIGNGSSIVDVQRIHNQFLTNQVRTSTSMNAEVTAFQTQMEELNGLLAGTATGINPAMQSYFGALQTAIEDPSSLPARQLFLAEAEGLAGKFNTVGQRLTAQNEFVGQQMGTVTDQVSRLASNIASYNNSIAKASAQGAQPNDLLDARDETVRQLSEYVGVTVVPQDDNTVNLFVGTGQPLVVGNDASSLIVQPGRSDPNRVDVHLKSGNTTQEITGLVSGGELGGLIKFRGELDNVLNSVGRMALSMASEFNGQLAQGLDLNGKAGAKLFADINSTQQKADRSVGIGESKGSLSVSIEDTSKLTTSDYEVTFTSETEFTVSRVSDNSVSGPYDLNAETDPDAEGYDESRLPVIDGFRIELGDSSPQAGDRFLVMPTRSGASVMNVQMKNPQELAFASPVSVKTGENNRGTAQVSGVTLVAGSQPLEVEGEQLSSTVGGKQKLTLPITFTGKGSEFVLTDKAGNELLVTIQNPDYPKNSDSPTIDVNSIPADANLKWSINGYSFEMEMTGTPKEGDVFTLNFNTGTSDNRNALQLSNLQTDSMMGKTGTNNKGFSFADGYGTLIQHVGTQTAQARAESEATGAVLKQATNNRDSVSAVNLDEEAANLIKFEQYYNASAQVIQVARTMFDTLMSSIR